MNRTILAKSKPLIVLLVSITLLAALVYGVCVALTPRLPIIYDAVRFNLAAQRLLNTRVFSYVHNADIATMQNPTIDTTPGYTVFLAAIYNFLPHYGDGLANAQGARPIIAFVQFLLAVFTAPIIAYSGYRIGGVRLGWIAGLFTVAYLPIGINSSELMSETLSAFLFSSCLALVVALLTKSTRYDYWLIGALGVLGGATAMVRPVFSGWLLVALALWLVKTRLDWKRATIGACVAALSMAVMLMPWTVRNWKVTHRFIPFSVSGMPLLDGSGGGAITAEEDLFGQQAVARGQDPLTAIAKRRLQARWDASHWEFIRWKYDVFRQGVCDISHLPRWLITTIPEEDKFNPLNNQLVAGSIDSLPSATFAGQGILFALLTWYHRLLFVLALVGLWFGRKRFATWALFTLPVWFIAIHLMTVMLPRYVYPTMPATILLAAYGLLALWTLAQRARA